MGGDVVVLEVLVPGVSLPRPEAIVPGQSVSGGLKQSETSNKEFYLHLTCQTQEE